jgi:hypothetical protein
MQAVSAPWRLPQLDKGFSWSSHVNYGPVGSLRSAPVSLTLAIKRRRGLLRKTIVSDVIPISLLDSSDGQCFPQVDQAEALDLLRNSSSMLVSLLGPATNS